MKRILKIALGLNNLRKIYNIGELFKLSLKGLDLQFINKLEAKRTLVLSPHPDDEIFGMAGTLALLENSVITVLYLCDGGSGTKNGTYSQTLASKRYQETRTSAKILGLDKLIFWKIKDGKLSANKKTIKNLNNLLEQLKPEIIFLPHLFDNHPDHFATGEILAKALKIKKRLKLEIWGYEIWSPTFINRLVDISKTWKIKEKAILAHKTQLQCRDYLQAIKGLNSYRAKNLNKGNLAEGFLYLPCEVYLKIHRKFL